MDPLTHTLTGALIGQAGLKRRTGLAMPALIVGANLPDVDVACFLWLDGVEHLAFRRGITHGPIAWVLLPLLLAGALWWFDRWQAKRGQRRFGRPEGRLPVRFGWLYGLSFIACLTHPALDWLNVYGIRLLEPFSSRWFYGDVLFIVDVWLWAILGVGLWLSLRRERRGGNWRRPTLIASVVAVAYVGVNGALTAKAERDFRHWFMGASSAQVMVIASPPPLTFWKREVLVGDVHGWTEFEQGANNHSGGAIHELSERTCDTVAALQNRTRSKEVRAFLFWSRAPFAELAPDGSVLIRDARYYDPRARNRFTVDLPDVRCEPMPFFSIRVEEAIEAVG